MGKNYAGQNLAGANFRGQNLVGANFRGANLEGADFSGANLRGAQFGSFIQSERPTNLRFANFQAAQIQGADFSRANLEGANLEEVYALSNINFLSLSFPLLAFSFPVILISTLNYILFYVPKISLMASRSDYINSISTYFLYFSPILCLIIAIILIEKGISRRGLDLIFYCILIATILFYPAIQVLVFWICFISLSVIITIGFIMDSAICFTICLSSFFSSIFMTIGFLQEFSITSFFEPLFIAAFNTLILALSLYFASLIYKGNKNLSMLRLASLSFVTLFGTSFYRANLNGANLNNSNIGKCNFLRADLTRTSFRGAHGILTAYSNSHLFKDTNILRLLVTGDSAGGNFLGTNLQGAYLAHANLADANLKQANLSGADLSYADLSRANLCRAACVGTDFNNVRITGAILEAWNIDASTCLAGVEATHVFLLEKPNARGDQERRPHDPDRDFAPGDFEKYFQQVLEAMQLLIRDGLNPEAFNAAFQVLMEKHGITPADIQGIEKKGSDVMVTLNVAAGTNKAQVEADFHGAYDELRLKAAVSEALLESERVHNERNYKLLALFAENNPTVNVEAKAMANNPQFSGDYVNGPKFGGDQVMGNKFGGDQVMGDKIGTQINHSQNLAQAIQDLRQIFAQLDQAYPNNPTLVGAKTLEYLEANPSLKQRIISAAKEAGTTALAEALDHPAVTITIAGIKGFLEA